MKKDLAQGEAPPARRNYRQVWLALLLGWLSLYMVRVGISPILPAIMKEFDLSFTQAGLLSSAVFWAYTLMQLPSGYLGDRWGHRRFLLVGTLSWSVLCLATSVVGSFGLLLLVRFFTGMAEGTYFGNDRPLVNYYTPADKKATGQGVSALGMGLGMGLGILLAGEIAQYWGWRWVFVLYTIPSVLAFCFIYKVIKEPAKDSSPGTAVSSQSFAIVFTRPYLWCLYLSHFCVLYFFWVLGAWSPTIFMELGAGGLGSSGLYASVMGLVSIPALLISGRVSDRLRQRPERHHWPLVIGTALMALLSLLMGLVLQYGVSLWWFALLLLLGGAIVWGFFPPFYALLADAVPLKVMGTTFGAANTAGFAASLVAPWLTGFLRDRMDSFASAFFLCAIVMVIGLLSLMLASRLHRKAND